MTSVSETTSPAAVVSASRTAGGTRTRSRAESSIPQHGPQRVAGSAGHRRRSQLFWSLAGGWLLVIAVVTIYLARGDGDPTTRLVVGNLAVMGTLTFSVVACVAAAARPSPARSGWTCMAVAMGCAAGGQLLLTVSAGRGRGGELSIVAGALSFVGVFALIIALVLFPKPQARLISRFRSVLDAIVITAGVLLVSEATVLDVLRPSLDLSSVAGMAALAYPIASVALCSVVLTLGMRRPADARLTWLVLGSGLLCLAISDSLYARLVAQGGTNLMATPLVCGYLVATVLIGLAALLPPSLLGRHWNFELASRLVPYAPAVAAALTTPLWAPHDPFPVAAWVLLITMAVRQVMIVYENLSLTRDLEAKVASRTAELRTFASIVTSSQDAIIGMDLDAVVTVWNPAASRLFGLRPEDVIGRGPDQLPAPTQHRLRSQIAAARRGEPLEAYETDWRRPDGSTVPVAIMVSPVLDGDVVMGVSFSARDITERRREAELLEHARQEALQSSRLKSEFLATMSHEIRTPMNGVIGLTSLLMDTDLDPQQRGYAEGVHSAGQSLLDVINDILDFSKLEAGKVVIESDDFDLRRLVAEVGNLLAPAAYAKGLELLVDYPADVPSLVRGDHVRVRQILLNLASNAVKFTHTGEVTIRVVPRPAGPHRVALRFEVVDSGIGIAEADQEPLFESFSQADASTTRRYGGTGLGLAICRRLVEVMGGEIGLTSSPGKGSTFWFTLELPLGATDAEGETASQLLPPGLRALVVDDNATNRTILEAQLRSWQVEVDLCESGAQALDRLREGLQQGRRYDLAVLDMMMPDLDGLELARTITADPQLTGLPMMMLTSAQVLPTEVFREAGISRWATKPFSSPELYDRLVRLLTRAGQSGEDTRPAVEQALTRSRGRILVVEDNAVNQMVAVGLVARLGFETVSAGNGLEALKAMQDGQFAAVLMDCHMPVMDGFLATEEIRRREPRRRRTPIIALTAGALAPDRERCLAAGMDDFLAKPIDAESLAHVLDHWVPERRPGPDRRRPREQERTTDAAVPGPAEDDPPPSVEQVPVEGVPVVDHGQLESLADLRTPDGSSLLARFVEAFAERSAARMQGLRRAGDAGDDDALAAAAHELRGSAATIGAARVAALCAELEAGRTAVLRSRPRLLDDLEAELGQANAALHELASVLV